MIFLTLETFRNFHRLCTKSFEALNFSTYFATHYGRYEVFLMCQFSLKKGTTPTFFAIDRFESS